MYKYRLHLFKKTNTWLKYYTVNLTRCDLYVCVAIDLIIPKKYKPIW